MNRTSLRAVLPAILALMLLACQPAAPLGQPPKTAIPQATGEATVATRLVFGMNIPGGGRVTEEDWGAFLRDTVTPRFPEGFTVAVAYGQWKDTATGRVVREPSRILYLLHKGEAARRKAVADVIRVYKTRFRQQAVLRWESPARVSFE